MWLYDIVSYGSFYIGEFNMDYGLSYGKNSKVYHNEVIGGRWV